MRTGCWGEGLSRRGARKEGRGAGGAGRGRRSGPAGSQPARRGVRGCSAAAAAGGRGARGPATLGAGMLLPVLLPRALLTCCGWLLARVSAPRASAFCAPTATPAPKEREPCAAGCASDPPEARLGALAERSAGLKGCGSLAAEAGLEGHGALAGCGTGVRTSGALAGPARGVWSRKDAGPGREVSGTWDWQGTR